VLDSLEPIKTTSLKDIFVTRLEELILSGELKIGQKLPSERDLAEQLNVSRPVVHEGLVELAARGMVTLKPRSGAIINDYRKQGSITLLSSLINYHKGTLEPRLFSSLLEMRIHLETEFALLAAERRTADQLKDLERHLKKEDRAMSEVSDYLYITDLDFDFHLLVAMATGNMIYPMILNSFKQVYTNLSSQFFKDETVTRRVFDFHRVLVDKIKAGNSREAALIMKSMLEHGEEALRKLVK